MVRLTNERSAASISEFVLSIVCTEYVLSKAIYTIFNAAELCCFHAVQSATDVPGFKAGRLFGRKSDSHNTAYEPQDKQSGSRLDCT